MFIKSTPQRNPCQRNDRHPQLPASGRIDHLAGLTGLRGIVAWWVVLFHFREYLPLTRPLWFADFCGQGYLAVDLFFTLSGFIIAHNYRSDFHAFASGQYLRFIGVRLARIYPLHIFMLTIFLLNPIAILMAASQPIDSVRYDPVYFVLSIFLLQNWGFTHALGWNIPAWSISTEWFAYLCFPFIAWAANRVPRGFAAAILTTLLPLIVLAAGLFVTGDTLGGSIERNGLFRCITEFTAGIFLYRLWRQFGHVRSMKIVSAVLAVGCLWLYALIDVADFWVIPIAWASFIVSLSGGQRAFNAIFSNRVVELVGSWSYSTYLVHYFVRDWVKFLLVRDSLNPWIPLTCYLGATAIGSVLLFRLVEIPGRRFFRDRAQRFTENLSPVS